MKVLKKIQDAWDVVTLIPAVIVMTLYIKPWKNKPSDKSLDKAK